MGALSRTFSHLPRPNKTRYVHQLNLKGFLYPKVTEVYIAEDCG